MSSQSRLSSMTLYGKPADLLAFTAPLIAIHQGRNIVMLRAERGVGVYDPELHSLVIFDGAALVAMATLDEANRQRAGKPAVDVQA